MRRKAERRLFISGTRRPIQAVRLFLAITYTWLTMPVGISAITYFSTLPVKRGRRKKGSGLYSTV